MQLVISTNMFLFVHSVLLCLIIYTYDRIHEAGQCWQFLHTATVHQCSRLVSDNNDNDDNINNH